MAQAKRIMLSLMLAITMSIVALPAEAFATEQNTDPSTQVPSQSEELADPQDVSQSQDDSQPQDGSQNSEDTQSGTEQPSQPVTPKAETPKAETPKTTTTPKAKPAPSRIFKKGKFLYYKTKDGKTRTKKGFFTYNGNIYYTEKGGKIVTSKTFKVGKYRYRAFKNGKIAVGVYKWGKDRKLYYSDSKGRWVKIKSYRHQKGVKWKGKWYFLQTNSQVATKRPVVINNKPYYADANGVCTPIALNNTNNEVVKVARKQVGKHTKSQVKGFWTWFFGTSFVDTDITPWCGTFVGWCFKQGGKYNKIRPIGNIGYVPRYTSYANRKGKWVKKSKAKPGDIIIFGRSRHVGIVERVYKGYIYTIEGNSGPTAAIGTRKPGAVTRRVYKLNDKDIRGVMHP